MAPKNISPSGARKAAPRLKLFYRCGEPESARWVSDTIGEVEIEKPKIGTTASVEDRGRDSLNYSTVVEHRPVVSKEEIMSLPDLHGYWKYGDAVVPFRLPLAPVRIVAEDFVERQSRSKMVDLSTLSLGVIDAHLTSNIPVELVQKQGSEASTTSQKRKPKSQVKKTDRDQRKFEYVLAENQKPLASPDMRLEAAITGSQSPPENFGSDNVRSATPEFGMADPDLEATMFDS